MVTQWAVLDAAGFVTNVIEWDGDTATWSPPVGTTVVPYDPALPLAPLPPAVQNEQTLHAAAQMALLANRDYLAIPTPTAEQTAAQVRALSQQVNGLTRLLLQQFDGTN